MHRNTYPRAYGPLHWALHWSSSVNIPKSWCGRYAQALAIGMRNQSTAVSHKRYLLYHDLDLECFRRVVIEYFETYETDLIAQRKGKSFKRKRFWAAGVNDLWCVDQHDKWKRFGLALHLGVEPYSGKLLWLRVWHSNSDPGLICKYYIDTVRELKGKYERASLNISTSDVHTSHPTCNTKWSWYREFWNRK